MTLTSDQLEHPEARSRILQENRRFHDEIECLHYDDRMGVAYGENNIAEALGELERVLGRPLPQGGHVLDVGAGTGHLAIKLALSGQFQRVTAVDISDGMLAKANASARRHGVEIGTIVSDMSPLPMPDNSVDLVVGCAVLHHLPDVAEFLTEVARVLKPGAPCIFIGEPTYWGEALLDTVKVPVKVAAALSRGFAQPSWEHDHIDVHAFRTSDVQRMSQALVGVRLSPEGFIEPLLSQGLLAPLSVLMSTRRFGSSRIRHVARGFDRVFSNRWVPAGLRASMKFAAFAPEATP